MIIEVDEYKNKIKNYDPKRSEDFHVESAKLADIDFKKQLKTQKHKRIVFMAGGTASGKTEFAHTYLTKNNILVYDGTLKNYDGFKTKLDKIKRYSKNKPTVKVILIIPKSIYLSLGAFLKRERKMKINTFFETQIKSKLVVAQILTDTKFRVDIYVSSIGEGKLKFSKLANDAKRKYRANFLLRLADIIHSIAVKNNIE
ncbi:MAG: hypothetical protein QG630_18 [Patescibacteria group bacterium]|nr:hypothetical protein [Patescibacteria group bacterium]